MCVYTLVPCTNVYKQKEQNAKMAWDYGRDPLCKEFSLSWLLNVPTGIFGTLKKPVWKYWDFETTKFEPCLLGTMFDPAIWLTYFPQNKICAIEYDKNKICAIEYDKYY